MAINEFTTQSSDIKDLKLSSIMQFEFLIQSALSSPLQP